MTRLWFTLSLIFIVALTLISGVVQGRFSNRWGPPDVMLTAAEKLAEVPTQFGDWRLQSSEEMSAGAQEQLECVGSFIRTYANQRTGEQVNIFMIVGPPGPTSVHTPEICYASRNYTSRDARQQISIADRNGGEDVFWALSFKSKSVRGDVLRTYYAWSTGDHWSAPPDARWAFAGQPYLYKIQLSSNLSARADLEKRDTCRRFLEAFLPVAKPYLVAPAAK